MGGRTQGKKDERGEGDDDGVWWSEEREVQRGGKLPWGPEIMDLFGI